jgi:hypothetical protein
VVSSMHRRFPFSRFLQHICKDTCKCTIMTSMPGSYIRFVSTTSPVTFDIWQCSGYTHSYLTKSNSAHFQLASRCMMHLWEKKTRLATDCIFHPIAPSRSNDPQSSKHLSRRKLVVVVVVPVTAWLH